MNAPTEKDKEERKVVAFNPMIDAGRAGTRWQLKEHADPGRQLSVPEEVTIEDLEDPRFWPNIVNASGSLPLRAGETIKVLWDDFAQYALLLVREVDHSGASVAVLEHRKNLTSKPLITQESNYKFERRGPKKWCAVRITDGVEIVWGYNSEDECRTALRGRIGTRRRP